MGCKSCGCQSAVDFNFRVGGFGCPSEYFIGDIGGKNFDIPGGPCVAAFVPEDCHPARVQRSGGSCGPEFEGCRVATAVGRYGPGTIAFWTSSVTNAIQCFCTTDQECVSSHGRCGPEQSRGLVGCQPLKVISDLDHGGLARLIQGKDLPIGRPQR